MNTLAGAGAEVQRGCGAGAAFSAIFNYRYNSAAETVAGGAEDAFGRGRNRVSDVE